MSGAFHETLDRVRSAVAGLRTAAARGVCDLESDPEDEADLRSRLESAAAWVRSYRAAYGGLEVDGGLLNVLHGFDGGLELFEYIPTELEGLQIASIELEDLGRCRDQVSCFGDETAAVDVAEWPRIRESIIAWSVRCRALAARLIRWTEERLRDYEGAGEGSELPEWWYEFEPFDDRLYREHHPELAGASPADRQLRRRHFHAMGLRYHAGGWHMPRGSHPAYRPRP